MPISYAKQEGKDVRIYNADGNLKLQVSGTLIGYTNTTVTVKNGSQTRLYEEKENTFNNRVI